MCDVVNQELPSSSGEPPWRLNHSRVTTSPSLVSDVSSLLRARRADISRARDRAEAEALLAADKAGTSDPFAVVTLLDVCSGKELHAKEKLKTEVVKKTLAPRWDAAATFGAHAAADAVAASVLRVALFDHDRMSTSHDPLGEVERVGVWGRAGGERKRE